VLVLLAADVLSDQGVAIKICDQIFEFDTLLLQICKFVEPNMGHFTSKLESAALVGVDVGSFPGN
jgi:hypothetical protein